jgi:hypothetical protein
VTFDVIVDELPPDGSRKLDRPVIFVADHLDRLEREERSDSS